MVADVDLGQHNRFKLLWLIGDLSAGKWTEAWVVDHRERFTSGADLWSAAWKDTVHLVWSWDDRRSGKVDEGSGVFHVSWTPAGFGRKVRLYKGERDGLDMAVDPDSGRVLVVFSTEQGDFVASRPAKGRWTRPTRLHADLTKEHHVSVRFLEKGSFVIRTRHGQTKEWLLKAK
jgi:hypothetical protein